MAESVEEKDVTDLIGAFGPWQRNIFIVVFLIGLPAAWNNLLITLVAPPVDHWCAKPNALHNVTEEEWKSMALPVVSTAAGESPHYSKCEMYEIYDRLNETSLREYIHESNNHSRSNSSIIPCMNFEFDHSQFKSTIVEEWNLVCSRAWLMSTSQSVYMVGYFVAVVFLGQISDRFGRRPVMLISVFVLLVSGIVCAFSPTFIVFCISRFFIAIGRAGLYVTAFVLLMETVGPKYRPVLGLAREFGWSTGYVTLPGIAWLIRKWDLIQLAISVPVACFVFMWCLIPESPRWLLTQQRFEDAEKIVTEAAKKNGREISGVSDILRRITPVTESVKKWFDERCITTLSWPGNSPNLNPVQNCWQRVGSAVA